MKFLFANFVVVFAATILTVYGKRADWEAYKKAHRKNYSANSTVDALRAELFSAKDAEIKAHNRNHSRTFDLAHSHFSDLTPKEKKHYHGLIGLPSNHRLLEVVTANLTAVDRQLPSLLDYRNDPCLAAVKNQGSCGSCWAFSAITPLEFAYCKKHNNVPVVLSEQQLIDCDPNDNGCNGGWYTNAWYYHRYIAGGAAKQALYTYTAKKSTCKFATSMIGGKVSTYGYVQSNAAAMQVALQKYGPLSVAIAVVPPFYSYASGVYTDKNCDKASINHGVVVVGWGTLNGINYWVVRNSWGATWGQKGYILMQRGVNKCMIETYPAYVIAA